MINPQLAESLSEIKYEPPKTLAGRFVEQISTIESEGIRKIVVDPSMMENMLSNPASAEAGLLMQQLMGNAHNNSPTANLPSEAAALMQQMLGNQKVEEDPNAGVDMIRKRPEFLEKAIHDAQSRDRFEIDIEGSSVLDLYVNKSTKQDVVNTLKTLSKVSFENSMQEAIFYYTDIGLSFYFDENDVINEIEVDEKYRRKTTKGLKTGDPIEKAIELYGAPRMKSAKGAIWNTFSILMGDRENEIRKIRLKIRG